MVSGSAPIFCSTSLLVPHCWHWYSYRGMGCRPRSARGAGLRAQPDLDHPGALGDAAADQAQDVKCIDDAGILGRRVGTGGADVVERALAVEEAQQLDLRLV